MARPLLETDPRFGDHAEDSLGTEEEAVRRGPGTRAGYSVGLDRPGRRHHPERFHEVVDVGVVGRVVPARAGRDPSADRAVLERLGEVPEGQCGGSQLVLEVRPIGAGTDPSGTADRVDLRDAGQSGEIDRHDSFEPVAHGAPFDTADDRRAAAEGDRSHSRPRTPVEKVDQLPLVPRAGDEVGCRRQIAGQRAHHVAERLPVGVGRSRARVALADPAQRVRRHDPDCGEVEPLGVGHVDDDGGTGVGEACDQRSRHALELGSGHRVGLPSPTPPRPGPLGRSVGVATHTGTTGRPDLSRCKAGIRPA